MATSAAGSAWRRWPKLRSQVVVPYGLKKTNFFVDDISHRVVYVVD
jgi:hypothetical protein